MNTRPYDSPLRAEQAAATRARIVETAVGMLGGSSGELPSMQEVADAAGVSVRTLYRHFATRDDLLDGVLGWLNEHLTGERRVPITSPEQLAAAAPEVLAGVARLEPLYRALFATAAGRESHRRSRHTRHDEINGALASVTSALEPAAARRLGALIHLLSSSHALLFMKDYWELDADEASRVMAWAIRTLTSPAALNGENGP